MHRVIYEARPDIQAVVHAHPPHATAFAVAGLALDKAILSEVVLTLGCVPLADYWHAINARADRRHLLLTSNFTTLCSWPTTVRWLLPKRSKRLLTS
jgi:ribulose-5-phosphate 4-epimerase/fuculose-1-phosphate aldolase